MQQEVLFQKYRIIRLLGKGSTAKVYLTEHIKLKSYRAIKCISKNHPLYHSQINESLILKSLKHSCIPIIYDIEEDDENSYIVEQYLEGETLKEYVMRMGVIREDIIIHFTIQLCDLMEYLHSLEKPILYMDLKPDNIMVSEGILKLIDFGSARWLEYPDIKQEITATRGYAAPELYSHKRIDERCDVYGIGMLLYYMVTGTLVSKNSTQIDNIDQYQACSKQLKDIINHCLKYNASQRISSCALLKRQLSAIIRKNKYASESSSSIKIAVAGAQYRIGATHLSFRLCNYFTHQKIRCLYQEKNTSGCIRAIKNSYEGIDVKEGIYEIEGMRMLPYEQSVSVEEVDYRVIIQDFGMLEEHNKAEFLEAEIRLLVLGAKDWELAYDEKVLSMLKEHKDICFLFNFLDGKQFQHVLRNMGGRSSYRIPYEPDPYAAITEQNGLELFRELTRACQEGISLIKH
ncbi:MAG: serine/threonine-protein kinase [Mobilitalea sp.]